MIKKFEIKLGRENLIVETGRMAKQADGACTIQLGGTVILATAVSSDEPREDVDFFPLTVEYQEKTYAAGKIPGGFFKREGKPSEKAVLTSRLIDRPIRPLFPAGYINETQVVAMVLSSDGENDSDILAMIGASTALTISDIPFDGPIGAVRVGRIDGKFIVNPTFDELKTGDLDIIVAGTRSSVTMIEAGAGELSEEVMADAIAFAHRELQPLIDLQEKMAKELNVKKREYTVSRVSRDLVKSVKEAADPRLDEINKLAAKEHREEAIHLLTKELIAKFVAENSGYSDNDVKNALAEVEEENMTHHIIRKNLRVDGRRINEIRKITCDVGLLPRTHGSALFTRGQTQSLAVTTLGTSADEQTIDALSGETSKNFMLHYNFPPFSVGEAKPIRGPGRREIGHGALAERALRYVMPSKDAFPYTVRVVSDILESNGSSSMATVCASTLSLMDAGVPISKAVSGIAMGLVKEDNHEIVLTDIGGIEDHYGSMDFKIAGTIDGITAVQMDLKIKGISIELIKRILTEGKVARLFILDKMLQAIAKPKDKISDLAPHIVTIKLPQNKIGEVIGPGGKNVKKIIQETGVTIDIDDDGICQVASQDGAAIEKAVAVIKGMIEEPEIGRIYAGKIKRIMNFGAFCEFMPGREGLIHVSELAGKFVKNVEDVVKIGDEVMVKLIEIDQQGRVNLSKKQAEALSGGPEGKEEAK